MTGLGRVLSPVRPEDKAAETPNIEAPSAETGAWEDVADVKEYPRDAGVSGSQYSAVFEGLSDWEFEPQPLMFVGTAHTLDMALVSALGSIYEGACMA